MRASFDAIPYSTAPTVTMPSDKFTNLYPAGLAENGNYCALKQVLIVLNVLLGDLDKKTVSLLRSLPGHNPDAISGRFSSLLPPSFAPGRFAAYLSSGV